MTDRRAELEAVIDADPSDVRAFTVLADHLQELGDPRGELIALAIASESDPALAPLVDERVAPGSVFWPWTTPMAYPQGWRRGFVLHAQFADDEHEVLAQLLAHPSGRFLQRLNSLSHAHIATHIAHLAAAPRPNLHGLVLGGYTGLQHELGDVSALWPALPALESLTIMGVTGTLGELPLPGLHDLFLDLDGLSSENAATLRRGRWPKLERFTAIVGVHHGASAVALLAELRAWLASDLPALEFLDLINAAGADFCNSLVEMLVETPLPPRLKWIALQDGCIDDRGAALIDKHIDAFANRELDINRNQLSPAGVALLARHRGIVVGSQTPGA